MAGAATINRERDSIQGISDGAAWHALQLPSCDGLAALSKKPNFHTYENVRTCLLGHICNPIQSLLRITV